MNNSYNRDYNYNYNYGNIPQEFLYRQYTQFVNNTSRILNNSIILLSNQQNQYNTIFANMHQNRNNTNFNNTNTTFNREPFRYGPTPLARNFPVFPIPTIIREDRNPNIPSINNLVNNITYCLYSDITHNTNTVCPITQRDFSSNDIVIMINSCNHIFEPQSILTWFSRCSLCPLCRASIINQRNNRPSTPNNNNSDENNREERESDRERDRERDSDDEDEDGDDRMVGTRFYIPNRSEEMGNYNQNNSQISFAQYLANIISNEINREQDFSGNIQIELGLQGRQN